MSTASGAATAYAPPFHTPDQPATSELVPTAPASRPSLRATNCEAGSTRRWALCSSRRSRWQKPDSTALSAEPGPSTRPQRRSAEPTPWGCGWKSASSLGYSLSFTRSSRRSTRNRRSRGDTRRLSASPRRARAFQLKRPRGLPAMPRLCPLRGQATVPCSMSGAAGGPWAGGCAKPSKHAMAGAASPDAIRGGARTPTTSSLGPLAGRRP